MATKTFKTRILLKYDSYTNWVTNNPVLKAGEVAIATIASGNTQQVNSVIAPQTLMKVGDGVSAYNTLPFVSALAADVYDWAKASVKPSYNYTEIGEYAEYRIAEADGDYKLQVRYGGTGSWADVANDSATIPLSDVVDRLDNLSFTVTPNVTSDGVVIVESQTAGENGFSLKLAHDKIGDGSDASTASTPFISGYSQTGTLVIPKITRDEWGHIDGLTEETVTITMPSAQELPTGFNIDATGSGDAVINVKATGGVNSVNYEITHDEAGTAYTSGNDVVSVDVAEAAATIKIPQITVDKYGHVNVAADEEITFQAIQFEGNYDATTNKAATMADVTAKVADLNGAMHFEGIVTTEPKGATPTGYVSGDVVIYKADESTAGIEYVFDGTNWYQLGDESIAAKEIDSFKEELSGLSYSNEKDSTVLLIKQDNGAVSATYQKIEIDHTQVKDFDAGVREVFDELDKTVSQESKDENGYVSASVSEENGLLTGVSVVLDKTKYVMKTDAAEWNLTDPTKADATGAAVPVITSVSQTDGKVSASGATIQFNTALSSTNKAATMADVIAANLTVEEGAAVEVTADTVAVTAYKPTADANNVLTVQSATVPTVVGVKNAIDSALAELDNNDAAITDQWVTAAVQADGQVTVSRSTIKINQLAENDEVDYIIFDCGNSSRMI